MIFGTGRKPRLDIPAPLPVWSYVPKNVTAAQYAEAVKAFIENRKHMSQGEANEILLHLKHLCATSGIVQLPASSK